MTSSTKRKLNVSLLIATLSMIAGVPVLQEAFGQGIMYTVSELSGASVPCRLNNSGDVAGRTADPATGEGRATTWSHGGQRRRILGKLQGGDYSSASGINDMGQVVGAGNTSNSVVPFLWMSGHGFRRIALLPGDNAGQAQAVNRYGHVTGYSSGANGKRGFLWTRGNNVRDLGVLPGGTYSSASDVNDADEVVGVSGSMAGDRAVLWTSTRGHNRSRCAAGRYEQRGYRDQQQWCGYRILERSPGHARVFVDTERWNAAVGRIAWGQLQQRHCAERRKCRSWNLNEFFGRSRLRLDDRRRYEGSEQRIVTAVWCSASRSARDQQQRADSRAGHEYARARKWRRPCPMCASAAVELFADPSIKANR